VIIQVIFVYTLGAILVGAFAMLLHTERHINARDGEMLAVWVIAGSIWPVVLPAAIAWALWSIPRGIRAIVAGARDAFERYL
jgi:hypothetical protein